MNNSQAAIVSFYIGERAGTRTQDPLIKSQMLYRLSYALVNRARFRATVSNIFRKRVGSLPRRTCDTNPYRPKPGRSTLRTASSRWFYIEPQ